MGSSDGPNIITSLPLGVGDSLNEGSVVVEVTGRPLIALEGPLPVYRDFTPTNDGPDVLQLEEALARLGYRPGRVDGVYDGATSAAVEELYRAAGYQPPRTSQEDRDALTAAADAVASAQSALDDAQRALEEARSPLKESEQFQLDRSVEQAQAALDELTEAPAQVDLIQARLDVNTTYSRAADAARSLRQARSRLPPGDTALRQLEAEWEVAGRAWVNAQNALKAAQEAIRESSNGDPGKAEAIKAAEDELKLAKLNREERMAGGADTAEAEAQVAAAEGALANAKAELGEAQARVGVGLPAAEVVFLPTLPRTVRSLGVEVGAQPSGPVMTVVGEQIVIDAGLSDADRRLVSVGDEAVLEEESLGLSFPAVVSAIADQPGGLDLPGDRFALRLVPREPLPLEALNSSLRISIPIRSTGTAVLAVPFVALTAGPDGSTRVEVERSPGEAEVVEVVTGLRADGYVQIEAVDGAALTVGDRVVVGQELRPSERDIGDGES